MFYAGNRDTKIMLMALDVFEGVLVNGDQQGLLGKTDLGDVGIDEIQDLRLKLTDSLRKEKISPADGMGTQDQEGVVAIVKDGNQTDRLIIEIDGYHFKPVFPAFCSAWTRNFESYVECKSYLIMKAYCLDLWIRFWGVPVNEKDEIEQDWYIFPAGTDKYCIWNWFENVFDISVAKDLPHYKVDVKILCAPQYKVIFDKVYYAAGQELEKIVGLEFFSQENGYDEKDFAAVKDLSFVDSVILDGGYQSVIRLN